jgi:hypothetical protein
MNQVVTEHTIRNYLSKIYEKLGISSRVELALYAQRRNRAYPFGVHRSIALSGPRPLTHCGRRFSEQAPIRGDGGSSRTSMLSPLAAGSLVFPRFPSSESVWEEEGP